MFDDHVSLDNNFNNFYKTLILRLMQYAFQTSVAVIVELFWVLVKVYKILLIWKILFLAAYYGEEDICRELFKHIPATTKSSLPTKPENALVEELCYEGTYKKRNY